ncbi:MAG: S8 family serine peptidase [Gemmatimonadaceae bacterium]
MSRTRATLAAGMVAGAIACSSDSVPAPVAPDSPAFSAAKSQIADRYIIVFDRGVPDVPGLARALTAAHGGSLHFIYQHAIKGFAARLPAPAAAAIARHPSVTLVEADQEMVAIGTTQANATWGLDRVDQRDLPLSTSYTYNATGSGVTVYIIDTGIRTTHQELGGRASVGFDALGGNGQDCHGHGTHVAGTAGGTTYGVAKSVTLIAVRVLDCNGSGSTSGVIAGVDWVTSHHAAGAPASANMSLGGGASASLDQAVESSIADGVSYAVAAGNGDFLGRPQDACNSSPARVPGAMTIGATDKTDQEASWSNYGSCVDMLAPGVGITSAWSGSDTETNTISGTSMATPHVAGAMALYLQGNPGATPSAVEQALESNATPNKIGGMTSTATPNLLLYTLNFGGGGATNSPPTASFSYSCTDLTCSFTDQSTDADGTIQSRSWTFGDGASSIATNPSHTYAASGTYTVTLTVTDNGGAQSSTSQNVTVTSAGSSITLSAVARKVKGVQHADLTWSGAASVNVDVFRDNVNVTTTANDGAHTDNIGTRGGGSYVYRVCEAGTTTCSNEATVTF